MIATRLVVSGRVQGVGYRDWCRREAARRGLTGLVRNLSDGTVEVILVGPSAVVDEMLAACRGGPPAARVEAIALDPIDDPNLDDFFVLPTR